MTGTSQGAAAELTPQERREQVWRGLRLVVIDTETTGGGSNVRAVSLAAITVRRQSVTGSWATLIDPGVPISARSTVIHGVTDDHVRNEPAFENITPQLINTLTATTPEETVVFVAHKASYDLGVIKTELDRFADADGVLTEVPDVAVLDTHSHLLHTAAGLTPKGRNLGDIAALCGVTNVAAHTATGDALATAQVVIELINRAADNGHASFASLHAAVGGHTTHTHETSTVIRKPSRKTTLTEAHAASHNRRLSARPTGKDWLQWQADVTECALAACPRLPDRLHAAPFTHEHARKLLSKVRPLALPDEDGKHRDPVLNTVAHAVGSNLHRAITGTTETDQRHQAQQLLTTWSKVLDVAQPCGTSGTVCPGCAADEECGRNTWWRTLIPALRGTFPVVPAEPAAATGGRRPTQRTVKVRKARKNALTRVEGWFRPAQTATPGHLTALRDQHPPAAAFAVWTLIEWHHQAGRREDAARVAATAVAYGYLDPRTVNHYLGRFADARREGDLETALALCDAALEVRDRSTDHGWRLITSRRAHLAGLLARRRASFTDEVDEDGNPIPRRRHHPETPARTRPLRFARTPNTPGPTTPGTWIRLNEAARRYDTTPADLRTRIDTGDFTAETIDGVTWLDEETADRAVTRPTDPGDAARVPIRKQDRVRLRKQPRRRPPGLKAPAEDTEGAAEVINEPAPVRDPDLKREQPPGHHPGGGGPWTISELDEARARLAAKLAEQRRAGS